MPNTPRTKNSTSTNMNEKPTRGRKKTETNNKANNETNNETNNQTLQETQTTEQKVVNNVNVNDDNNKNVDTQDNEQPTEFVSFNEKDINQTPQTTQETTQTTNHTLRPRRQNFIRQPRNNTQMQTRTNQRQTNNSLKFSYEEILQRGDTKLSENDTESLLKYLIATTHRSGQNELCKVFKNTLTGMKNETTLPNTTYHYNYSRPTRKV